MSGTASHSPAPLSQHSPGPWTVEPLQWDHGASIAVVASGEIVCTIAPENEDDSPDASTAIRNPCDEANARLIAAAPEMLDALKFVRMTFADIEASKRKGYYVECPRIVAAAIAAADGGDQ